MYISDIASIFFPRFFWKDLTFFQLGELSFYFKKVFTILQKVFQLFIFYQNELSLNDIIGGTQQK